MPRTKKKELTWDEIGETIGKKIEKEFKGKKMVCEPWCTCHDSKGGGFGRLVFISAVLYAMNLIGMLEGIPLWVLVLIALGFAGMRL